MARRHIGTACTVLAVLHAMALPLHARPKDRVPTTTANEQLVQSHAQTGGLVDQDGHSFRLEELRGQTIVLNFIFTHCPAACPMQTQALRRVAEGLPKAIRQRVRFVSVSIDPERDSPRVLKAFARKQGLSTGEHWSLVTGDRSEIEALTGLYSSQAQATGAGPLDHRTEVRLLNPQGKLLQTYRGAPLDIPRLIREIQAVDRLYHVDAAR